MTKKPRYSRIDNIRAIAIISMVSYHAVWDLVFLYGFKWQWYKDLPGFIWQQSICWTFILLSGFCHSMSRQPFKNAMKVFLAGLLVSAVTWILAPNIRITFGVLTLLGSAGLIVAALDKPLKKLNPFVGILIFAALFALTRAVNSGYLGFGDFRLLELPRSLYANYLSTYLGFPFRGFSSSDYFSLLPWLNLYLVGYYINKLFVKNNLMALCSGAEIKPLRFLSRHSLVIYLLHQPILSALFYMVF